MIAGLMAACGLQQVDGPLAEGVTLRVAGGVVAVAAVEREGATWHLSAVEGGHDGLGLRLTAGPSTVTSADANLRGIVADWGTVHLTASSLTGIDGRVSMTDVTWTDDANTGQAALAQQEGETLLLSDRDGALLGRLSRSGFRPL